MAAVRKRPHKKVAELLEEIEKFKSGTVKTRVYA